MASNKKAKKAKYTDPKTGEFRHSDGDRRHRLGALTKDAVKHKKKMQELGLAPEVEAEADEWDESEIWDGEDESGAGETNA